MSNNKEIISNEVGEVITINNKTGKTKRKNKKEEEHEVESVKTQPSSKEENMEKTGSKQNKKKTTLFETNDWRSFAPDWEKIKANSSWDGSGRPNATEF